MLIKKFLRVISFHAVKFVGLIKVQRSKVIGTKVVKGPAKDSETPSVELHFASCIKLTANSVIKIQNRHFLHMILICLVTFCT